MTDLSTLRQRYGTYPFHHLTQHQQDLLLHRGIIDKTDGCGYRTVEVNSINTTEATERPATQRPVLHLVDAYTYVFQKNAPGGRGDYAIARIPVFQGALGVKDYPTRLSPATFLFQLPDASVVVEYITQKDRV
ncbi:MAG: hypothetical protein ACOCWQ_02260 [Nanoarchaeota archaeon]